MRAMRRLRSSRRRRRRRVSPVRMSLRRGKGVDGASVVWQVRMKVVRRDREGVRRAAE